MSVAVCNLGVTFDQTLSFDEQVAKPVRPANYHLRTLARIRRSLTMDATKTMVQALILSRLDYCNSFLNGVSDSLIQRLQKVQNSAARLVARCPRREPTCPVLKALHWLPVKARIDYKVLLLAYKVQNHSAPIYLSDMLPPYIPACQLQSQEQNFVDVGKAP